MKISNGIRYHCSNGGNILIIDDAENINQTGVDNGYAFWGDIYVNAVNNLSMNVSSEEINGTLYHENDEKIMEFNLAGRDYSSRADLEFRNLQPDSWYRLLFNEHMAETRNGKTFGPTDNNGILRFREVTIPNEQ